MSSEWPAITLDELTDGTTITYGVVKPGDECEDGVKFVRGGDVVAGQILIAQLRTITPEVSQQYSRTLLQGGELLVSLVGNPGEVALVPPSLKGANIARQVGLVRVDAAKADANYVQYFLRSKIGRDVLLAHSKGSVQQVINLKDLKSVKVPLPPINVQRSVAGFMQALDDRITLLRETNATLEAIAQALFKSWFVDFDPVRAKMEGRTPEGMDEATAALFPDSFEETELGEVPRGWRVAPVGEVVNVTDYVANGSFAALKENVTLLDEPSHALYVRTTDFNSGFSGEFRYVDKSAYEFLSKSSLDGSEVIISNVGDVGTVFRPPRWLGFPMTLGSNAVALKKPEMSAFLYFHFSGPLGQHDIQSIVTGSAQLKFNKTNFRALKILLPESECLAAFEGIANSLWSYIEKNFEHVQTLSTLRDTLLPRLISGQVQLTDFQSLRQDAVA